MNSEFLAENALRCYPFASQGYPSDLPRWLIADAHILIQDPSFLFSQDAITIDTLETDTDNIYLTITNKTDTAQITIPRTANFQTIPISSETLHGKIITGPVATYQAELPTGNTINLNPPAKLLLNCLHKIDGFGIRSLTILNKKRTKLTPPPPNSDCYVPYETEPEYYKPHHIPLTGIISIKAGRNIYINKNLNEIIFQVVSEDKQTLGSLTTLVDLSQSTPITEPLNEEGKPETFATRFDDAIQHINGLTESEITIIGKNGVKITNHPSEHTIVISIDKGELDIC